MKILKIHNLLSPVSGFDSVATSIVIKSKSEECPTTGAVFSVLLKALFNFFQNVVTPTLPSRPNALLHSGCTPPRTYSSLTSNFSAPNHRKDMKLFVHDPHTSKNAWNNFQFFLLLKIGRKK